MKSENDQNHDIRPGHVKEITSTANPVIKSIRALSMKKNRDEGGLFLAEGMKLVTDAILNGWRSRTFIHAKGAATNENVQQVAAKARALGADILEVNEKVLGAISRRENPQTVIGVFEQAWTEPADLFSRLTGPGDVLLGLDRVRDPGNLGTIIRTADAVGAKGILLIGETTDPFSLEATRASMGSIFNIALGRISETDLIDARPAIPARVAGTHLEGTVDYRSMDWSAGPVFLMMGNEQQGLTDKLAGICDDLLLIPMAGRADSLNLAVATGVTLFEVRRGFLEMGEG